MHKHSMTHFAFSPTLKEEMLLSFSSDWPGSHRLGDTFANGSKARVTIDLTLNAVDRLYVDPTQFGVTDLPTHEQLLAAKETEIAPGEHDPLLLTIRWLKTNRPGWLWWWNWVEEQVRQDEEACWFRNVFGGW